MAKKTKWRGEMPSPGRDFLIRMLINRKNPSIVDHMFFFQMGTSSSRVPEGSPLSCLLKRWKGIDPDNLHKKALIFFCTQSWPQYPLGDQEKWPEGGTLNYNTILQLDLFCKREGKWTEIPYVQLFFLLKEHPQSNPDCGL
jgi:hypothetical protein